MKINVGSKNQTKVKAVQDAVHLYPKIFPAAEIEGIDIVIDLFGHPKNMHDIVEGARDRAKKAYVDCLFSFGLESGLIEVPLSNSGYMEISAAAIFDGTDFHVGLSPAFEWPPKVTEIILKGEMDASKAFKELGLTEHEKLGAVPGGVIAVLTEQRTTREECMKLSIIMALIQVEKAELYQ